jgi:hypothetical protein
MKGCPSLATWLLRLSAGFFAVAANAQVFPDAVFRPALLAPGSIAFSRSGSGDLAVLDHGLRRYVWPGAISRVDRFELNAARRLPWRKDADAVAGLSYERTEFHGAYRAVLEHEEALTLNAQLTQVIDERWRLAAFVRPGYYGTLEDVSAKGLNAPALIYATYEPNHDAAWLFGVSADAFARYPVLPVAGLRWQAGPGCTLALGYPETALTWQASDKLRLRLAMTSAGGSYRAQQRTYSTAGTLVDVREVRAGLGVDWNLCAGCRVSLEAGRVLDREIDLHRRVFSIRGTRANDYRHLKYDGGQANFITVGFAVGL